MEIQAFSEAIHHKQELEQKRVKKAKKKVEDQKDL